MVTKSVSVIEVGPRDGLQNTKGVLSSEQKKNLIRRLLELGFQNVEAGSFVRADKVPSMADSADLADALFKERQRLWYLIPNLRGLQIALEHGVTQMAFFTAASDTFNQKNIGMSTGASLGVIKECVNQLKEQGFSLVSDWAQKPGPKKEIKIRIYISTAIGCPYEGKIAPKAVVKLMDELLELNPSQFSLGDTIGVGVPKDWKALLGKIDKELIAQNKIALHCHNTYGTALACVAEGLHRGVRSFDASIGGLGGCPFAPGATGNLATEDLVYFLEKEGFETGITLESLKEVFSQATTGPLTNNSQVAKALAKTKT